MGFSLARLTLYGTLSCIDEDLRNIVKSIPTESTDRSELIGAALLEKLKERRERDLNSIESDLIDFMDMGDALSLINRHKSKLMAKVAAFFDKHSPKLTDLIPIRNRVMHSRPIQFSDMAKVDLISQSIRSNGSNIFPGTMVFLKHIEEDPYYPFSIDVSDIQSDRSAVAHNLPLPDFDETGFLGRETETAQLVKACKGPWPIITVVAEGGYGKTALALQASYELLDDPSKPFEYVVWTSSKTTRLALHDVEEI